MNKRKWDVCGEEGFQEYEGEFRCEKHHSEVKRKANIEFEKKETLKKYAMVIVGIVVIVIGAIAIYQFVSN